MPDAEEILGGLSSEQRGAIWRLNQGPKFLGPQIPDIPRGTAAALRRRGLIDDDSGSKVRLTALGTAVAAEHARSVRRLLDG